MVEDALQDARFAENPLVCGAPFIRFYAGTPLISSANGYRYGTVSTSQGWLLATGGKCGAGRTGCRERLSQAPGVPACPPVPACLHPPAVQLCVIDTRPRQDFSSEQYNVLIQVRACRV